MKDRIAKFAALAALVTVLCVLVAALTGCELRDLENKLSGIEADSSLKTVEILIGDESFEVTTRKAFLHDALKLLKEEGKISTYTYSGGEINAYITAVGELKQDFAAGKYYSVWHNVDNSSLWAPYSDDFKPSRGYSKAGDFGTYTATKAGGVELYYSNVGVGILPLFDGCTYAIFVD